MKTTPLLLITLLLGWLSQTIGAAATIIAGDDFEPDIDRSQWVALGGTALATNYGGSVSGANALCFESGPRFATTRPWDTSGGGRIEFYLRFADSYENSWWHVHLPDEGVVLEYTIDAGSNWVALATYNTWPAQDWERHALAVPAAAQSPATQFRWRQLRDLRGAWALDDVVITLGDATPLITKQPAYQVTFPGGIATFAVEALAVPPPSYQWQCNGTDLPGQTNAQLTITGVTAGQAGNYRVVVSNSFGVVISSSAILAVAAAGTTAADDFEAGISPSLWGAFGGTVLATNYGGSVSGANSLWFGGEGARFAATSPLDTALGGWIDFWLRMSNDDDGPEGWDDVLLPMHGISFEYSIDQGTNWVGVAAYRIPAYTVWSRQVMPIPAGALSPGTLFRWRQIQTNSPFGENWALDDVRIMVGPIAPLIVAQPASLTVSTGGTATFRVNACGPGPLSYQWQFNGTDLPGETNVTLTLRGLAPDQGGTYRVVVSNTGAAATSSDATLTVLELAGDPFRIASLTTNRPGAVAFRNVAGEAWGGIAVSRTQVFYSGQSATARFAQEDLSGAIGLNQRYAALLSDVRTGTAYALANGTNLLGSDGGTVTTLLEIDENGLLTGGQLPLSQAIELPHWFGLFAGYGRVVVHTGTRVYDIALPAGTVTDLGPMPLPVHRGTWSGGFWGVAEFWDGALFLVCAKDAWTIARTRVPDGETSVVGTFENLGDTAALVVCPWRSRWYFADASNSRICFAEAAFEYPAPRPPVIFGQPRDQAVDAGAPASLAVVAFGMPLLYQWQFNGNDLAGATNGTLILDPVQPADAGSYAVVVANDSGSVTSQTAVLTVRTVPAIVGQPQSQTAMAGTNVTFSVSIIGPGPLAYQWSYQGAAIPGATNATLVLPHVDLSQTGSYAVVVSNLYGSATSSLAILTVFLPPTGAVDFTFQPAIAFDKAVYVLAAQTDGKILVGGSIFGQGEALTSILRLQPDGSVDSQFLHLASRSPIGSVYALALQPDGKAILGGEFTAAAEWPNRICRLNADGSAVDPVFNPGIGPNARVHALALQPDGKILIAGEFTAVAGVGRHHLARLNADGSLDPTFNAAAGPNDGATVYALAVQSDGKVLIGGNFTAINGLARNGLARLTGTGLVDTSFNPAAGLVVFDLVYCLAVLPDNKILAGGTFRRWDYGSGYGSDCHGGVARFNPDGSLDPGFNPGVHAEWPGVCSATVRTMAVQPDGKIVIGGYFSRVNGVDTYSLARVHSDGRVDLSWAPNLDRPGSVSTVALQADGKVLAGGAQEFSGGTIGFVRFFGGQGPPALGAQPRDAQVSVGFPATFSVVLTNGQPPLSCQWFFDGTTAIPGATNTTLTLPQAQSADAGKYHVSISNAFGVLLSQSAALQVVEGPRLVSAGSADGSAIGLCFNVPVTAASAQSVLNYSITSGGPITNAALRPDGHTVLLWLRTPACTPFAVTASGIRDAGPGHLGGGTAIGRVEGLIPADLGGPAFAGSTFVSQTNTFEVVAGGADFWDSTDQGHFVYATQTGDFDVRMRVSSLVPADFATNGGLMVRESLVPSSRTLNLATMPPTPMRSTTEATLRTNPAGTSTGWGFPGTILEAGITPSYWPNVWLRLTRAGNLFEGYHSPDALHWVLIGETTQSLPNTLLVGMAATAHNNATYTTGRFSDYGPYEGPLVEALETPGRSWISGGDSPWFAQTAVTHDGGDAAQSGAIGHAGSSTLQTILTGPGTLRFWWKVSSEPGNDRLKFELAGTEQCSIAGEVDWEPRTVEIPAGSQTVAWTYSKNESETSGQDAGWLDQVEFTPTPAPPLIVVQPADQSMRLGGEVTFSVEAASATPLSYQWLFNATNPVGLSLPTLTLSAVASNQVGTYCVVVSNAMGVVTSQVATLELAFGPPIIVQHPQSLTVLAGNPVTFAVQVTNTASLPLTYQWRKGTNVLETIVLRDWVCAFTLPDVRTNVTATNGPGLYRVVVRNGASPGGVASGYATLTVLMPPAPTLGPCTWRTDGGFQLQFSGPAGAHYTVLASTNLVDWVEVGVAAETTAGQFEFSDRAVLGQPARFYRLRSP